MRSACELQDIARGSGPRHAEQLANEGYPDVAELICSHHNLPQNAALEAQLLSLADKLVLVTRLVALEERFAAAMKKCLSVEAQEACRRRLRTARGVIERHNLNLELM